MDKDHIEENEPISVVFRYEINSDHDAQFKTLSSQLMKVLKQFPGFKGKHFFYHKFPNKTDYYVLVRFDTFANWKKWEESDVRMKLVKKLQALTPKALTPHFLTGLESWFSLATNHPIIPPPRYKIALLTWTAVYSLLLLIFYSFGQVLNRLYIPIRFLIVSLTIVLLLTYFIMPLFTRLLKYWLYPNLVRPR